LLHLFYAFILWVALALHCIVFVAFILWVALAFYGLTLAMISYTEGHQSESFELVLGTAHFDY
jgi:hypothetical protein